MFGRQCPVTLSLVTQCHLVGRITWCSTKLGVNVELCCVRICSKAAMKFAQLLAGIGPAFQRTGAGSNVTLRDATPTRRVLGPMGSVRPGLARTIALLSIGLLAAGCAAAVDGSARPAADSKSRAITGQTIKKVFLSDGALSKILNQSFESDPRFPSRFGGPETLQDSGSVLHVDCLGVAMMLQKNDYQSTNVKHVAMEAWRRTAKSMQVTSVKEGVVSLTSADDADALFAKFSQQWQKCDGATLFLPEAVFKLKGTITNVKVASSVLTATTSVRWAFSGSDSESIPEERVIGVRANCLVEVEVDVFNASDPSPQGAGAISTGAVDIAQAMMDKVSALI